jgi:hypothetical protein
MEAITARALPQIGENAKPENVEADWITNFFDKCRLISDEDMQLLWAKILAGEANSPGRFSKRTVNSVASLSKTDATLFSTFCSFCWTLGEAGATPFIYPDIMLRSESFNIYNQYDITQSSLLYLDNIGLVSCFPGGYSVHHLPQYIRCDYHGIQINIEFPDTVNSMANGMVLFTSVGKELAPICISKGIPQFLAFALERWTYNGLVVSSPYPIQGFYPAE